MLRITDTNDALVFLLKGVYDAEQKIQSAMPGFSQHVSNRNIQNLIGNYRATQSQRLTKIGEVFRELNALPVRRGNHVIHSLIDELVDQLATEPGMSEKERIVITGLQAIFDYKMNDYLSCCHFATSNARVSEMLHEIIDLEKSIIRESLEKQPGDVAANVEVAAA